MFMIKALFAPSISSVKSNMPPNISPGAKFLTLLLLRRYLIIKMYRQALSRRLFFCAGHQNKKSEWGWLPFCFLSRSFSVAIGFATKYDLDISHYVPGTFSTTKFSDFENNFTIAITLGSEKVSSGIFSITNCFIYFVVTLLAWKSGSRRPDGLGVQPRKCSVKLFHNRVQPR